MNDAAMASVGSIAGIFAAAASPPSHNQLLLALSFCIKRAIRAIT